MSASASVVYTYPQSVELREVEQVLLPQMVKDDPIFDEFPMVDSEYDRLVWEQKDNYQGLQQVRGLEGAPKVVRRPGSKTYDMEPGVYGEFTEISEKELTQRRKLGSWDQPVNIDDLVGTGQELLLQRRLDRVRQIIFTLLSSGTFSVARADGTILHTDTFPIQALTAGVPWTTYATAVPSQNLRAAQLLALGQSVSFGADAKIWMNRVTANALLTNQNPLDMFGRRIGGGNTSNTMEDWNRWAESNDLPQIQIYDKFYLNDSGVATRFIPNGKAILIGKRTNGANLGEYRMTRNANNPRLEAGAYTRVIDLGEITVPRRIQIHDGHNGGPVIFFPGAIVVLTVF